MIILRLKKLKTMLLILLLFNVISKCSIGDLDLSYKRNNRFEKFFIFSVIAVNGIVAIAAVCSLFFLAVIAAESSGEDGAVSSSYPRRWSDTPPCQFQFSTPKDVAPKDKEGSEESCSFENIKSYEDHIKWKKLESKLRIILSSC